MAGVAVQFGAFPGALPRQVKSRYTQVRGVVGLSSFLIINLNRAIKPYPRRQLELSPGGSGQVRSTAKLKISLQILNRIESFILSLLSVRSAGGRPILPPSDRIFLATRVRAGKNETDNEQNYFGPVRSLKLVKR